MDYEAYPEMALPSLKSIATQATQKWPLFGVAVTHRLGRVPTGEESILIAVSSGHRRETYEDPAQEPEWKANENTGIAMEMRLC